jgi:hypothetical protein
MDSNSNYVILVSLGRRGQSFHTSEPPRFPSFFDGQSNLPALSCHHTQLTEKVVLLLARVIEWLLSDAWDR